MPVLCCYCGKNLATTKDHIPPKGIFNKPRPSDLITVPACRDCNSGASGFDEQFRTYLGMHVAWQRGESERLFKEGSLRSVRHNKRLFQTIVQSLKPVDLLARSGIYIGKGSLVLWDSEAHDAVITRIVRGLYFHHYGEILADNADIEVHWHKSLPDFGEVPLFTNSIAGDAFVYAYNEVDDAEFSSVWVFQFYKGHWASGVTLGKKELALRAELA